MPEMDLETYRETLGAILRAHGDAAKASLTAALLQLPERTRQLCFHIHVGQESDGCFSVRLHLEGMDLHSLNKAINPHGHLFDVRYGKRGFEPRVPMFDGENEPFSVNDAIADIAGDWVEDLWATLDWTGATPPALIVCQDVFGTFGTGFPRRLKAKQAA